MTFICTFSHRNLVLFFNEDFHLFLFMTQRQFDESPLEIGVAS